MRLDLSDWNPKAWVMFVVGTVIAAFVSGSVYLTHLSWNLSTSNQAQILATVLGSVGTLLLAGATFYNILQTNRSLELQLKEREKPLILDELSYVIQPAITSLENNLLEFRENDNLGCAFEWVYIDGPKLYSGSRGPDSVRIPDALPTARLAESDREMYEILQAHDRYVMFLSEQASEFHDQLKPEIQRLLDEYGIEEIDQSLKVVTSGVLKELEHFGESHQLYDFWEEHGKDLIKYGKREVEPDLEEIKSGEKSYEKFVADALENLKQRKAYLKQEYSISEDEISAGEEDNWRNW